jgi:hypothetical protein
MTAVAVGLQVFPDLKVGRYGATRPGAVRGSTPRTSGLELPGLIVRSCDHAKR